MIRIATSNYSMFIWIILIYFILLSGCSQDDYVASSNDGPTYASNSWLTIVWPETNPYTTYCDTVSMGGEAYISNKEDVFNPSYSDAVSMTGVHVTWKNLLTGETGQANQRAFWCNYPLTSYFYACDHWWSATIPLVPGDNEIEITAQGDDGNSDTDPIMVSLPEYTYEISGRVTNHLGEVILESQSNISLTLSDGIDIEKVGYNSFTCVPNGNYTLVPSSKYKGSVFDPEQQTITVANSDVEYLDFKTEAYSISGIITDEYNNPDEYVTIKVESNEGEDFVSTDSNGAFKYFVPPGTYTLTPRIDTDCIYYCERFTPSSITVDVTGSNINNQDFHSYKF
jgi:hypothetical protein